MCGVEVLVNDFEKKYFRKICRIKNSYYLCTRNQGNEVAKKERVL